MPLNQDDPDSRQRLERLKQRADLMGIQYHPNIGPDKLQAKIDIVLKDDSKEASGLSNDTQEDEPIELELNPAELKEHRAVKNTKIKPATRAQIIAQRKKEAGKLVRVRITNMNPNKKDWPGEIISVGSAKLGTFKKYVPYNVDSYHVPVIIYNYLKERQFVHRYTVTSPKGVEMNRNKLLNEFSIEILPPLDSQELHNLANEQARTRRLEDE